MFLFNVFLFSFFPFGADNNWKSTTSVNVEDGREAENRPAAKIATKYELKKEKKRKQDTKL